MEIAILVVFAAIFGGALFLAFLIWFFFRRRNSPPPNPTFPSRSNQEVYTDSPETDFDEVSVLNYENNCQTEKQSSEITAYDSPNRTERISSGASQNDYSPPSYSESSFSSGDGGSSSDSGSSSSSGSSSD